METDGAWISIIPSGWDFAPDGFEDFRTAITGNEYLKRWPVSTPKFAITQSIFIRDVKKYLPANFPDEELVPCMEYCHRMGQFVAYVVRLPLPLNDANNVRFLATENNQTDDNDTQRTVQAIGTGWPASHQSGSFGVDVVALEDQMIISNSPPRTPALVGTSPGTSSSVSPTSDGMSLDTPPLPRYDEFESILKNPVFMRQLTFPGWECPMMTFVDAVVATSTNSMTRGEVTNFIRHCIDTHPGRFFTWVLSSSIHVCHTLIITAHGRRIICWCIQS